MHTGALVGIILSCSFFFFILVNFVIWYEISQRNYGKSIVPGDRYNIGKRLYTVPNLPLKGKARVLKEPYLTKQRELLFQITSIFDELSIDYWLSGGTLLGFTRHQTFIPWDDDCDLHTHWKNREYMFSSQFQKDLEPVGLEAIFLIGSSIKFATREGSAVRIRQTQSITPICDVFFVKESQPNIFSKVDSWNKHGVQYNPTEQWSKQTLFPTQKRQIDGLNLVFPNDPETTLQKQYGANVMTEMHARNVLFSHLYPFYVFWWVWKK
jgi:hypothetical protein